MTPEQKVVVITGASRGIGAQLSKAYRHIGMGFLDQRQWIVNLEQQGELRRIKAEVDWDREIGAVTRRVLEKKGPALLFENIRGYTRGRCTKLLVSGLGAPSRLALALGFPRDASNRELVQYVMRKNRETITPVMVASGPVKDVIVRGDAIDQTEFHRSEMALP
jgi:UbiD family decarboxylase